MVGVDPRHPVSISQARKSRCSPSPAALAVANPPVLLPFSDFIHRATWLSTEMLTPGQVPVMPDSRAAASAIAGLVAIVVVPDQLGAPLKTPQILTSHWEKAATYPPWMFGVGSQSPARGDQWPIPPVAI
jgi:hypothetical protein